MSVPRQRRTTLLPVSGRLVAVRTFAALIAVAAAGSASTARAECGDHVVTREMREMMAKYSRSGEMPAPPPAAPCRGPGCRGIPNHAPLAPAPILVFGASEMAAWIGSRVEVPASERLLARDLSSEHGSDGYLSLIFRPPESLS